MMKREAVMRKEKKRRGIAFVLLTSVLVIVAGFFLGILLDANIFTGEDGVKGHGMPIFTILLPIAAAAMSLIRIVLWIVRKAVEGRRRREDELWDR